MLRRSSSIFRHNSQPPTAYFSASNRAHTRCLRVHQDQAPVGCRYFSSQWPKPRRRRSRGTSISRSGERYMATAINDSRYDTIPFDNLPSGHYQHGALTPPSKFYEMRPFDTSSLLVLDEPEAQHTRLNVNRAGIPGDLDELLPTFDACLRVGKMERAGLVLKRLVTKDFLGVQIAPEDVMQLYNKYLETWLMNIKARPNLDEAEEMHKYFELKIHRRRLPWTPETIAFMLKASLLTTPGQGTRLERIVTRYMGLAKGDLGLEVLYCTDILSDADRAIITEICPVYNAAMQEEEDILQEMELEEAREAAPATLSVAVPETVQPIDKATHVIPPEVLATPQKGSGMTMLKKTLSLFNTIPLGQDISELGPLERREIQARLERDCVEAAVDRWREDNAMMLKSGLNRALGTPALNAKLYDWHHALEERLTQEIKDVDEAESKESKGGRDLERLSYGPFLKQSTPSRLAAITIISTLSTMTIAGAGKGASVASIINQVAKIVEEDIRTQQRETGKKAPRWAQIAARRAIRRALSKPSATEEEFAKLTDSKRDKVPASNYESLVDKPWPMTIKAKVGAALVDALLKTAKITVIRENPDTKYRLSQLQPAFTHANLHKRGKRIGTLLPNPALVEMLERTPRGDFLARHLPMVVKPDPWVNFEKGGFVESPVPIVRTIPGEKDQVIYTKAALDHGDMEQMTRGLDVLGSTAWKINRPVFDVMLAAWNEGKAIANFPAVNSDIEMPPEPKSSDDPTERSKWMKALKAVENERSGLHSVRCFVNLQLEIARAYRDQTFYFPHNVDFRGRAYPIPTYLNHMGADHVRGLLRFAEGREVGVKGLKWLKVQLANVFGYDKASLTGREQFAMDHLAEIYDSANNPLGGKRWWLEAEDPWQCLAACYELKAALDSPDPTKFVSTLPVHQDGTCNGLQHYAALGGDSWGAKQVNLEPGDKPADVYSAVANLVIESMDEDAKQGIAIAQALQGKIKRKVVKQTVMTNVYGVTFTGAKKQVLKQLNNLYPDLHKESGIDPQMHATYIAMKIFKALSTMFRGAHDIQHWLGEIGGRVCRALTAEQVKTAVNNLPAVTKKTRKRTASLEKDRAAIERNAAAEYVEQFRSTIVWTTPLRMPVVQPYRVNNPRVVSTCLQDFVLVQPDRLDPVNRRKQLQAFPPNFIHSLDASHMMLSALECNDLGLTFAAVHDSFWTHAADVESMNRVLRDAFIRIHSEDVIGRLASEFKARYQGAIYLASVGRDTEAARRIIAHRKSGKKISIKEELIMEKQRMDLLSSEDPKKVKEGQKMVTPASIFESVSPAEEDLVDIEAITDAALGHIPDVQTSMSAVLKKAAAADDVDIDIDDDTCSIVADVDAVENIDEAASSSSQASHNGDGQEEHEEVEEAAAMGAEAEAATRLDDSISSDGVEPVANHADADAETSTVASTVSNIGSRLDAMVGTAYFAQQLERKPAKPRPKTSGAIQVWLPLTFPPVPKKGEFDVRRLKDSKYFFS